MLIRNVFGILCNILAAVGRKCRGVVFSAECMYALLLLSMLCWSQKMKISKGWGERDKGYQVDAWFNSRVVLY